MLQIASHTRLQRRNGPLSLWAVQGEGWGERHYFRLIERPVIDQ